MSTVSNAASVFSPSQINTTSSSSSSSTSSTAQAAGANASQQLAGNFNTFLQLLTTQLQNQNPLDPLDTNQFTQQLVEFASVEQQIDMNTNLQSLITMQQTTKATSHCSWSARPSLSAATRRRCPTRPAPPPPGASPPRRPPTPPSPSPTRPVRPLTAARCR